MSSNHFTVPLLNPNVLALSLSLLTSSNLLSILACLQSQSMGESFRIRKWWWKWFFIDVRLFAHFDGWDCSWRSEYVSPLTLWFLKYFIFCLKISIFRYYFLKYRIFLESVNLVWSHIIGDVCQMHYAFLSYELRLVTFGLLCTMLMYQKVDCNHLLR